MNHTTYVPPKRRPTSYKSPAESERKRLQATFWPQWGQQILFISTIPPGSPVACCYGNGAMNSSDRGRSPVADSSEHRDRIPRRREYTDCAPWGQCKDKQDSNETGVRVYIYENSCNLSHFGRPTRSSLFSSLPHSRYFSFACHRVLLIPLNNHSLTHSVALQPWRAQAAVNTVS
jgi:hypothetical protein